MSGCAEFISLAGDVSSQPAAYSYDRCHIYYSYIYSYGHNYIYIVIVMACIVMVYIVGALQVTCHPSQQRRAARPAQLWQALAEDSATHRHD